MWKWKKWTSAMVTKNALLQEFCVFETTTYFGGVGWL